jgi:hypothetical protein
VRLKGTNLVLIFESALPGREGSPLVLKPINAAGQEALIDLEGGNLDIFGGEIQCQTGQAPAYLVRVRGGDLRLRGCHLHGPSERPIPHAYRALICWEPSAQGSTETRNCSLDDSVLVSARGGVEVLGGGAHLDAEHCVLVSGGHAFSLIPDPRRGSHPDVQCFLYHNTVATGRALLHLHDVPMVDPPVEPIVVRAKANVFVAPFGEGQKPTAPAALLIFEENALAHGLLVWQGDSNIYDKRLYAYAARANGMTPSWQPYYPYWIALWGSSAELRWRNDVPFTTVNAADPANLWLPQLLLPRNLVLESPPPGADLEQLRIVKRVRP